VDKKQVGAWALFDFANSAYPAVMTTAVFPLFYRGVIVGDEAGLGELWWGRAVSVSALVVAMSAPLLGAIADRGGARKKFMLLYTFVCVGGLLMMTGLQPGMVVLGFLVFVIANVGFESAVVFYNAYLPDIAPAEQQGRVSGLGFGVGYLGSAVGLVMVLPLAAADRIELAWPAVGAFFLLFSVPAFLYLPKDTPGEMSIAAAASWGLSNFRAVLREVWALKDLRNFLFAFFFYIDAVLTIIVFAGVVAEETFGFTQQQTIGLFLIVQFSALIGAFALAKPTDVFGPKKVLNGVILLWIATGIAAYFVQDPRLFYALAVVAGLGLGSAQSASRAFMSSLIPEGRESEMFGFYAFCGKTSSFIGPQLFGYTVFLAGGNQRPGFLALTVLFVIGLVLLQRVRDPRAAPRVTVGA
jgi:UMF1 family MFS transporter